MEIHRHCRIPGPGSATSIQTPAGPTPGPGPGGDGGRGQRRARRLRSVVVGAGGLLLSLGATSLAAGAMSPPSAPVLPATEAVPAAPRLPAAPGGPEPGGPAPGGDPEAPTGLVTIESDRQQADNTTGIVTATGNVRILYPDRRLVATSRQAQYFVREGRIVLSGDVEVVQEGGNRIRAERLVYLVETERVLAQPEAGQQVFSQLIIQTENETQAPPRQP